MFRFYKILNVLFIIVLACNNGQTKQAKPEKVYRIVYESKSNAWYKQQAELWKKELENDPGNPDAWYNYYNANRYAHFEDIDSEEKKAKLVKIIEDMGNAIPDTYEYNLLKYWNTYDIHDISLIEKAYKLQPDRPDTYYPFISHYEYNNQKEKLREFCKKLYDSRDIAPWLVNYNYNVLMSVEKNAILITNGDNDTYPIWMLQNALDIRKDVTVVNISLAPTPSYLEKRLEEKGITIDYAKLKNKANERASQKKRTEFKSKFIQEFARIILNKYPDIPVYFALTVYKENIKDIREDLYIVGLAYQFTRERIDNVALIKKNFEKKFRLDHLKYDWYNEYYPGVNIRNRTHMNYIIPIIMLVDHYKLSGEKAKAEDWNNLALHLAEEAGNQDAIEEIRNKKLER